MPYRNGLEALQQRLTELEGRLDGLRARRTALERDAREEPSLRREAERLRREVAARTRLPLLQDVRVASPCNESWDAMTGDAQVRFCGRCEKNVYNLSAMSAPEAEALLASRGEKLCVRFYRR